MDRLAQQEQSVRRQIRIKEQEISNLERELAQFQEEQRRPLKRLSSLFDIIGKDDWHESGLETKLKMARKELEVLETKCASLSEARYVSSLPDAIAVLQSGVHETFAGVQFLGSGGIISLLSLAFGGHEIIKFQHKMEIYKSRARDLLPKFIDDLSSKDRFSMSAELSKYHNYLDELSNELAANQNAAGAIGQAFMTSLRDYKSLLQEITYQIQALLQRKEQSQSKPKTDEIQNAINEVKRQIKTRVGVRVACAEMKEQYPPEYHDLIDREFRKIEDNLRDR
jgi:predicted RNase H-like nuclease (RuvC/YqgF family)